MYEFILRDILNDEITRVNAKSVDAIIAILKKQQGSTKKNRSSLDVLERKGKRIKKNKTFYDDND